MKRPLISSCALAAIGVVMLVAGEHLVGALTVVFFGACALVIAMPELVAESAGLQIADVGGERAFVFRPSRAKLVIIAIGAAAFTATGILFVLAGAVIIGVLCAAVFGFFSIVAIARLFATGMLALTPTRVVSTINGHAEIAWDDIAEVGLYGQASASFVGITATEPERVVRRRGAWLARLNRRVIPVDLAVPANQLAGRPEHVLETLVAYLEDPERRGAIGAPRELARLGALPPREG